MILTLATGTDTFCVAMPEGPGSNGPLVYNTTPSPVTQIVVDDPSVGKRILVEVTLDGTSSAQVRWTRLTDHSVVTLPY